jgi:DNA-binding NtrC family response regulator
VHLPARIQLFDPAHRPQRTQPNLELIQYAVERMGGNKSEAARQLAVHRNTISNRLRPLGDGGMHNGEARSG